MAVSKSKFQGIVLNLATQIAENWCLCQYCHKNKPNWIDYAHWKSELETYLYKLNTQSIDNDNARGRWAKEILVRGDYNNGDIVYRQCYAKFVDEAEIDIPVRERIELCNEFASQIDEISECIGADSIIPYTCKWFPEVRTRLDNDYFSHH